MLYSREDNMKVILFTISLLILCAAMFANPIPTSILSEVWFAENGHMMMEFNANWYTTVYTTDLAIVHDDIPQALTGTPMLIPTNYGPGLVVDISEMIPFMDFNPEEDSIGIIYTQGLDVMHINSLKWGNSPDHDINPPLPGQSMALVLTHDLDYFSYLEWVKEEPPTPGTNAYQAFSRDTLRVVVTNQLGQPVPNAPIYPYLQAQHPIAYTDANGVFCDTLLAGRYNLIVKHPTTNAVVMDSTFWLEPNQTTTIPVQITVTANDDQIAPMVPKTGLTAYPSPCNLAKNTTVSFEYKGDAKLIKKGMVKIYDTKGRFVCQQLMSSKGTASWMPDRSISSGMYFARLISGNRIMDTTTITIMK
jgi:hypothetical protein